MELDQNNREKTAIDLSTLIESFRVVGILLQPFIPDASNNILNILNIEKKKRESLNFLILSIKLTRSLY